MGIHKICVFLGSWIFFTPVFSNISDEEVQEKIKNRHSNSAVNDELLSIQPEILMPFAKRSPDLREVIEDAEPTD